MWIELSSNTANHPNEFGPTKIMEGIEVLLLSMFCFWVGISWYSWYFQMLEPNSLGINVNVGFHNNNILEGTIMCLFTPGYCWPKLLHWTWTWYNFPSESDKLLMKIPMTFLCDISCYTFCELVLFLKAVRTRRNLIIFT